jgi:recombination protein RecA
VIFINQIREKIGVMFGSPETTPGGRALKFYSSVRIDIRRTGAIKDGDENVGNRVRAKVVKNKVAPPFRIRRVRHHVQRGHQRHRRPARPGGREKVCEKSGAWFSYGRPPGPGPGARQDSASRMPSGWCLVANSS